MDSSKRFTCNYKYQIIYICFFLVVNQVYFISADLQNDFEGIANLQTGPLTQAQPFDFTTIGDPNQQSFDESPPNYSRRPTNVITGIVQHVRPQTSVPKPKAEDSKIRTGHSSPRRPDLEATTILSTDCFARRDEILAKLQTTFTHKQATSSHNKPPGFQTLKPKHGTNETFDSTNSNFDSNEHVPQCTKDGNYEPIQCHKIGYCWCVNKYGQAIKNSAALAEQKLSCRSDAYDTEGNGLLVVTGTSERRVNSLLKVSSSNHGNNLSKQSRPSNSNEQDAESDGQDKFENDSERRANATQASLALLPYDCSLSQFKARERASNYTTDSIWIPRCDADNARFYAEKQCHLLKLNTFVCWCVDQITGLPLTTGEQLGKQPSDINCTKFDGILSSIINSNRRTDSSNDSTTNKSSSSTSRHSNYVGFSDSCDSRKRIEFVSSLIEQFRKQMHEFVKSKTSFTPPNSLTSSNPNKLNASQLTEWKFATLDLDSNGTLDYHEWFKFKNNVRVIDKPEDSSRGTKGKLRIERAQGRCWRDFVLFCSNGSLLKDVSLENWLNCTELPSKSNLLPLIGEKNLLALENSDEIPETMSESLKAAVRSKNKNPFLGILKPD